MTFQQYRRGYETPPPKPRTKPPRRETPKQGSAYFYNGRPYRAELVNFSRCMLSPLFRKKREIISRLHDYTRTIYASAPSVNISPNSPLVPVVIRRRK